MESSATQAIYTGAYIFVFVAALTITIYLFNSILDFSNIAYEFEGKIESSEILVNVPVEANRLLSADEAASYYYNYVLKDKYYTTTSNKEIEKYNVTFSGINLADKTSYKDVMGILGKDSKFILTYDSVDANGKINITIKKATNEQINQML